MTKKQVHDRVESWNWNLSIFEIYDELRDGHTAEEQEQLLTYAYHYFNKDKMINELASFFGHYNIEKNEYSPFPC
tara:strand:+ start:116 stop:340 length:225 start_codon:yes stop_codon:yes gene_type:complete